MYTLKHRSPKFVNSVEHSIVNASEARITQIVMGNGGA